MYMISVYCISDGVQFVPRARRPHCDKRDGERRRLLLGQFANRLLLTAAVGAFLLSQQIGTWPLRIKRMSLCRPAPEKANIQAGRMGRIAAAHTKTRERKRECMRQKHFADTPAEILIISRYAAAALNSRDSFVALHIYYLFIFKPRFVTQLNLSWLHLIYF